MLFNNRFRYTVIGPEHHHPIKQVELHLRHPRLAIYLFWSEITIHIYTRPQFFRAIYYRRPRYDEDNWHLPRVAWYPHQKGLDAGRLRLWRMRNETRFSSQWRS